MMALLKGFDRFEIRCFAEIGWLRVLPFFVHYDFFKLAELKAPAICIGFKDLI